MKKWFIFPILIFLLTSCNEEKNEGYITPEKALMYFKSIEEICANDSGKLWGENLYAPLMFVDRTTRKIFANEPDEQGLLKEKNGVYTGIYPVELLMNATPYEYGGTVYALSPLPLDEIPYDIKIAAIHSLFHRFQTMQGIASRVINTNYMDDREARLWLKLEWKALQKALNTEGDERSLFIRDALIFRASYRSLYPKYSDDANRFENYEGLATFTFTKLCNDTPEEVKIKLLEILDNTYSLPSYSRSYGFIHGALYASLLYDSGFDFKKITNDDFDLAGAVKEAYKIELPTICRDVAGSLAVNYNIDIINKEEEERRAEIRESIHKQTSVFTEKPVVFIELESPSFGFEPQDIMPFDTLGTLYTEIRVSDNWGKLVVKGGSGCLVSGNFKYLRVTSKGFKEEKNHVTGEGWEIFLNCCDWEIVQAGQNFFIRKTIP
ncbi:MAG TPA: hypothetical protein PLR88_04760 [Bacteroidales bacterium]|nr:hypothetical protein [Bacteroidales bacterium]HPT21237.1 hypothetical protein [Bacteroidales bacterium]